MRSRGVRELLRPRRVRPRPVKLRPVKLRLVELRLVELRPKARRLIDAPPSVVPRSEPLREDTPRSQRRPGDFRLGLAARRSAVLSRAGEPPPRENRGGRPASPPPAGLPR
jgi:hypothetical protein